MGRLCVASFGISFLAALVNAEPASAQEPRQARWSLELSGGTRPHAGWGAAIATAMRSGNLDGNACENVGEIQCEVATQPDIDDQAFASHIALAFRASPKYDVALSYSSTSAGSVSGYFDGGNTGTSGSDATLWIEMRARTLALSARYYLTSALRLGGGPALRFDQTAVTTASWFRVGGQTTTHTKVHPAFLFEGSVVWPPRSSLFVELDGRYSLAGAATFGPYDALNEQEQYRTTMPATRTAFGPIMAGLGLGLRF